MAYVLAPLPIAQEVKGRVLGTHVWDKSAKAVLLGLGVETRTVFREYAAPTGGGGGGTYTPPTTGQIWPRGDAPHLA